ncbi:MAG: peptidase domain-containing ABC transporter [Clostridia bacterium]|nr:peptidase domain-containing ABC transporter [Clostridia bacterium]
MSKLIKQHDERDCGAACLSMVASHYGLKLPISKYRELTKTDRNGTNLYGLVDGAEKIGLNSEALSGDMNELFDGIEKNEIHFPFIAHIITEDAMQHFVVVKQIKNNMLIIYDPAKGKIKYDFEYFQSIWSGYIVTFKITEEFKTGNYTKGGFSKFFSLLKGQYKIFIAIIILSFIISAIGIIGAFIFESMIDDFYVSNSAEICEDGCEEEHEHINDESSENQNILDKAIGFISNNADNFNIFFIMLIVLYALQGLIQFARGSLMSILSKNIDKRLILTYYNHLIDLPLSSLSTRSTGEYISRFSDASTIRNAISGATLTLLLDSFMVIACGIILLLENEILFLISLLIIVLYAIVIICYRTPIKNINQEVMENNAKVQSFLKESIDGVETIKSHQAEKSVKDKNTTKFNRFLKSVFNNNIINFSQDSICDSIELIGIALMLWVGFSMVLTNKITVGSLITFYALLAYFTTPIKNLIELQPMLQTAIVAAERLNDILDLPTESSSGFKYKNLKFNSIDISNLDFRYGNHNLILNNINLHIVKGEKIAIVGESGCGKTTLAKLLIRFYEPEKGTIHIDGINISEYSSYDIRNKIAYVNQETFLFSDTIRNNLIIGNTDVSDKEIESACRLSKANEFIEQLPFGYDTYLDENGKNLSGGQKQRLAIARALLRNPKLLILDEATSNLDSITESGIKDTLFDINNDLTCIIIAHRLKTIEKCDRIIVIKDNTIIENGTHIELLEQKGYYYNLYNKQ